MKISLHEKMQEYINLKGIDILKKLYDITEPTQRKRQDLEKEASYLQHKPTVDLTGKAKFDSTSTTDSFTGQIFTKYKLIGSRKIGFERDGIDEIHSLVNQIEKEIQIKHNVTAEFLFEKIFDWAISSYEKSEEQTLSYCLLQECENAIKTYNVYIPILYLESNAEFEIGHAKFCYLTDDYIKKLASQMPEEKRDNYLESFKRFRGQLFGKSKVTAQKDKAVEIAKSNIVSAIDILRMLSPTVEFPEFKIYYDVDFQNIYQIQSTTLVQPIEEEHSLSMSVTRIPMPFVIDRQVWELMLKIQLQPIHFFLQRDTERTELENLILKAIRNFSKAIANHDLYERVMKVFTVLESLLLPSEESHIIDSVCKYLPKLISDKIEERQLTIEIVKEMYSVRSAMVHHAKRKDFNIDSLAKLCIACRTLIIKLLFLSRTKKTKQEVLKEIDNRLMSA